MKTIKHMFTGVIIFLIFVWINLTLWGGDYFDSYCIKGKLKDYQAQLINTSGWSREPIHYRDRIVSRECSEFMRTIHFRDSKWLEPYKKWFQEYIFGKEI